MFGNPRVRRVFAVGFGLVLLGCGWWGDLASVRAEITATRTERGVTITADGKPFAEYRTDLGSKPIVWPLIGPTGQPVTRDYPMADTPGETRDHPHQRSLWFTHGDVNGLSFWEEAPGRGSIRHREYVEVRGGQDAVVVTRNDWLTPEGNRVLSDTRRLRFAEVDGVRILDFDIRLTAVSGPVVFGDTKEGTFGIRVAETIRVDTKKGGEIVNSDGKRDAEAWGKRAAWVDYSGPVADSVVGIAVLNHPTSFRFPTYWHVRTYGLFAANPFGWHDFEGNRNVDGSYRLAEGDSIVLRYRVILHRGRADEAGLAEKFAQYAAESPAELP